MTRDEFEAHYAANMNMTVEQLRAFNVEYGCDIRPCDCDSDLCRGWQMVNIQLYEEEQREIARLNHE